MDRSGNITVKPVSPRIQRKYANHMQEMTGNRTWGAFFNDGAEASQLLEEFPAKHRRELEKGWPVRFKVDPWTFGHWLGYDSHEVSLGEMPGTEHSSHGGPWRPASGGTEKRTKTRSGRRVQYMHQPSTGAHAYIDLDTDIFLTDEEAQREGLGGVEGLDDNAAYTHFVLLGNGKIESGWEYKEDAIDRQHALREDGCIGSRVYARRTLLSRNIDPANDASWHKGPLPRGSRKRGALGEAKSRCAYRLRLSDKDFSALGYIADRYTYADVLYKALDDQGDGTYCLGEPDAWEFQSAVEEEDGYLPLAGGNLQSQMHKLLQEIV
jgi:hypothetical protein